MMCLTCACTLMRAYDINMVCKCVLTSTCACVRRLVHVHVDLCVYTSTCACTRRPLRVCDPVLTPESDETVAARSRHKNSCVQLVLESVSAVELVRAAGVFIPHTLSHRIAIDYVDHLSPAGHAPSSWRQKHLFVVLLFQRPVVDT